MIGLIIQIKWFCYLWKLAWILAFFPLCWQKNIFFHKYIHILIIIWKEIQNLSTENLGVFLVMAQIFQKFPSVQLLPHIIENESAKFYNFSKRPSFWEIFLKKLLITLTPDVNFPKIKNSAWKWNDGCRYFFLSWSKKKFSFKKSTKNNITDSIFHLECIYAFFCFFP